MPYLIYNTSMKRLFCALFLLTNIISVSASELSKQATAFYIDNNPTKALDLILQINEQNRSGQDWLILGNILADKGELDNAEYMYKKAIEKDKKCYRAYYNIGNYQMEKGQFQNAIENYKKAVSAKNDNAYIYYNLGCAYLKIGDYKNARVNFNKAITQKSDVPEFHYNLAYVYKKLGNQKLSETYLKNYNKLVNN